MKKCTLPDKTELFCISPAEANLLYEDIFGSESYFKHGIALRDGACVLDVGANIGVFALAAHRRAKNVRVYSFEPLPPLFEVLRANVEQHHIDAVLLPYGLSAKAGRAQFTFYPHNTALSGQYADAHEEEQLARKILLNKRPSLEPFLDGLLHGKFEGQSFECELRTLSQVIAEQKIERIDLLKIDTEKAEADVIAGMAESDWQKVQQVVLEVHDIDGRLAAIEGLLQRHGFRTFVDRTPGFEGTGIFDLFALR